MTTLYVHPCQNPYFSPIPKVEYRPIQLTEKRVIHRQPIFISWVFPPEGCIKINTDGSFMPNSGLAGFGGVARDDKGRWLGGFYGRLGMRATSSLTAELWAIHGGLILAKNYDLNKVIIETDSNEAIKRLCLTGNVSKSHPDRAVIEECKSLISELGIVLIHTLRQGNNCADHLATLGRIQEEEMVIIDRPPHSVQLLLHADMDHVAYPRYPKHVSKRGSRSCKSFVNV